MTDNMMRTFKEDVLKNSQGSLDDWEEGKEILIKGKLFVSKEKTANNNSKYIIATIKDDNQRSLSCILFTNDELYDFMRDFIGTNYHCEADIRCIKNKEYKTMIIQNIQIKIPSQKNIDQENLQIDKEIKIYKSFIKTEIRSIKTKILKDLVTGIYSDSNLNKNLFSAPATEMSAYNKRGGLANMIVDAIKLTNYLMLFFNKDNKYNVDLMKSGVLLCYLGKAFCLEIKDNKIQKTENGLLNNESILSRDILMKYINKLQNSKEYKNYDFNNDLITDLIHMVSSVKNKIEYGAITIPRSKHALMLSCISEMIFTNNFFKNLELNADGDRTIRLFDNSRKYIIFNN